MPYDEGLAERLQEYYQGRSDVKIKNMFGGLCFMVADHMCCGIVGDMLMCRVGLDNYTECLTKQHAAEMDFTGKTMKGMIYVSPEGFESDIDLHGWVKLSESFVNSLPAKKPKIDIKTSKLSAYVF
jgi:TfoX/Sxy family transcriptional regulator of competence genes